MPAASHPQTQDLSFEDAMQRLEEIVSGMEGEHLPLEEMVSSYEEGSKLLRVCRQRIESARQRVELITASLDAPAGKAVLTAFDEEAAEAAEATTAATRSRASAPAQRRKPTPPVSPPDDDDIRLF